jgi:hypothetical protein
MTTFVIPKLGKYAILQNNLAKNKAELSSFNKKEQDFFARFAHQSVTEDQQPVSSETINASDMLIGLTRGCQETFFEARTIFPFMLFPDTISLDRQKLTIVHRDFFRSATIASVQLKDIMNVEANIGPLFGSLTLTSKHFLNNTQTINFLRRNDIIKVQRLIQGFVIAYRAHIDVDHIDREQLLSLLHDLGQGKAELVRSS